MLRSIITAGTFIACAWAGLPENARADGPILITQAAALAGGITPQDYPGFPVTLSLPGSYELASDLESSPNTIAGIIITNGDVILDLNGFRLRGQVTAPPWGVAGAGANITVRGGTVTNFKWGGIKGQGNGWRVENMRILNSRGIGVAIGAYATIRDSTIMNNDRGGVECALCSVEGNVIAINKMTPISILQLNQSGSPKGSKVQGNLVWGNWGGIIGDGQTGFGDNTVVGNGENPPAIGVIPLTPNACVPAC